MFKLSMTNEIARTMIREHASAGVKFTEDDVREYPCLMSAAYDYLTHYRPTDPDVVNKFIVSVQTDWSKRNTISTPQARGVLNVMLANYRAAYEAAAKENVKKEAEHVTLTPKANTITRQMQAAERARTQHVRLYPVEGRPGVFRTLSKSDPKEHYTLVLHEGVESCSCPGYVKYQLCKHLEAARAKVARARSRTTKQAKE